MDHIIALGEVHLRRILKSYADYYNGIRTHRSLNKDAPVTRLVQRAGVIRSRAILGGLHHHYARIWGFRYTQRNGDCCIAVGWQNSASCNNQTAAFHNVSYANPPAPNGGALKGQPSNHSAALFDAHEEHLINIVAEPGRELKFRPFQGT